MKPTAKRNAMMFCAGLTVLASTDVLSAQRGRGNAAARTTRIVEQFDQDQNGFLDASERATAKEWLQENRAADRGPGGGRGRRGRGRRGRGGRGQQASTPELPKTYLQPDQVTQYPDHELYDTTILRTIFLDFQSQDWIAELDAFYRTDVEVPATMIVDGKIYEGIGTAFRGNSSYFTVGGPKKSFNIKMDLQTPGQRLYGYKTLNLLNGHADRTFLRDVIHSEIGNRYTSVMRACLVRLVINGENWGVYVNVQQYNKDFLQDAYDTKKGIRWKIPAGGGGALIYQGEELEPYQRSYQIKTNLADPQDAWQSLIDLCRKLEQTADEDLTELAQVLDIDATLWFLALEFAILDGDGYFSRGSDYLLYQDANGRFRPVAYDSNEILARTSGRGGGGARPPTVESTPLELADRDGRPLARLLTVPTWRARYLAHVRTLALEGFDWTTLGPFVEQQRAMIDFEVQIDDKALYGYERFEESLEELREVVEERRATLLGHELLSGTWPEISKVTHTETPAGEGMTEVRVRAAVAGEATMVILYVSDKRLLPYLAIPMHDDGAHIDGAAGDGLYGAEAGTFATGTELSFYVEARTADGNKTTFHPAAAEAHPITVEIDSK